MEAFLEATYCGLAATV